MSVSTSIVLWVPKAPLGVWGLATNKQKKGFSPLARRAFFEEFDVKLPACFHQKAQKPGIKKVKQNQRTQMKKNKNTYNSKLKTIVITSIALTLLNGCATSNNRQRLIHTSLKQQNAILQLIKKHRASPNLTKELEKSESLQQAESELLAALEAIISSNKVIESKLPNTKSNKGESNE